LLFIAQSRNYKVGLKLELKSKDVFYENVANLGLKLGKYLSLVSDI